MIDRRRFLKGSALAAGLAPLGLSGAALAAPGELSASAFRLLEGRWFELSDGTSHYVQLLSVESDWSAPELEQFHLSFRGPASDPIAEGLYAVRSEAGDEYSLFVQPTETDAEGNRYRSSVSVFRPLVPVPEPSMVLSLMAGAGLLLSLSGRAEED